MSRRQRDRQSNQDRNNDSGQSGSLGMDSRRNETGVGRGYDRSQSEYGNADRYESRDTWDNRPSRYANQVGGDFGGSQDFGGRGGYGSDRPDSDITYYPDTRSQRSGGYPEQHRLSRGSQSGNWSNQGEWGGSGDSGRQYDRSGYDRAGGEYGSTYGGSGGSQYRSGQGSGNQSYGNQSYGNQSYGNHGSGNQYGGQRSDASYDQFNRDNRFGSEAGNWNQSNSYGPSQYGGQSQFSQSPYGGLGGSGSEYGQRSGSQYGGQAGGWSNDSRQSSSQYGGASTARRGQAPKNYKKSDERINDDVCEQLMSRGLDCSGVEVSVKDGVVTLTGEVCERQDKHRIEQIAADVSGVSDVENQLRMKKQTDDQSGSSASRGTSDSTRAASNATGSANTNSSTTTSSKK